MFELGRYLLLVPVWGSEQRLKATGVVPAQAVNDLMKRKCETSTHVPKHSTLGVQLQSQKWRGCSMRCSFLLSWERLGFSACGILSQRIGFPEDWLHLLDAMQTPLPLLHKLLGQTRLLSAAGYRRQPSNLQCLIIKLACRYR
jgi:hypothetical protein